MTDHETRLGELLRAAVPEAPEIAPPAPVRRSRGPVVAVLAAAAAVAVIAVVPVLLGGDETAAPSRDETADLAELPADPYAAAPCPDRLPPPSGPRDPLPALDEVTSIRLCAVGDPRFETTGADLLVPDDALLTGFGALADDVEALPTSTDPCPTLSYFDPYRTSLVVTGPDGPAIVSASACATVLGPFVRDSLRQRRVDAGAVAEAFVAALGRQRTTAAYPPFRYAFSSSDQGDWCDAPSTLAPVVPRRTDLAGAVLCPDLDDARATAAPIEGERLEALRDAWRRAPDPAPDATYDGYDDELASVVALTGQGDLVRLVQAGEADGLVMEVPAQQPRGFGRTSVVPITLDDLTGG